MARSRAKPDPILVKDQLLLLQSQYKNWGAEAFTRYMIWILGKREDTRAKAKTHSRLIPFVWNKIQRDVWSRIGQRNIALKPRQVGLTTWFLLVRLFLPTLLEPGTNSLLISQTGSDATKHFAMLRRAFRYFGATDPGDAERNSLTQSLHENLLHTSYSNRKELILDQLDNTIHIASAEVEEAGQGLTLARVVGSEVARWPGDPEETLANLKEAIIIEGTLDLESTANGAGGYFYEEYIRADGQLSDFVAHFHPWWWQDEYKIDLTDAQLIEMEADLSSDELRLRETFHLELEQIAFRRNKQKSLRHNFAEKYPEDPITAFLVSGVGYFDNDVLRARLIELQSFKPFTSFSGGAAIIFHKRLLGRKYIIGADVASGKKIGSGLDYSCAKVIDLLSGEEFAVYRNQLPPEDYAYDLIDLGRYFNDALIACERSTGPEAGGDGGTVNMTLIAENYPNIYYHKELIAKKNKKKKDVEGFPGFPTTGGTRPIILNKLRSVVLNNPELIWDLYLVKEALMFTRDERGRPAATEGAHDDDVMGSAIAQGVRLVELGLWDPLRRKSQKYNAKAIDDEEEEDNHNA